MVDENKIYATKLEGLTAEALALYVTENFNGIPGIAYYTPGSRSHLFNGSITETTKDGFVFTNAEDRFPKKITFTEVTYETFKDRYYKVVLGGKDILSEVSNTQELEDWYHKHFPR